MQLSTAIQLAQIAAGLVILSAIIQFGRLRYQKGYKHGSWEKEKEMRWVTKDDEGQKGTIVDISFGCESTPYYTILFQKKLLSPKVIVTYSLPPHRENVWKVGDHLWASE